jgi:hypothetical protein
MRERRGNILPRKLSIMADMDLLGSKASTLKANLALSIKIPKNDI